MTTKMELRVAEAVQDTAQSMGSYFDRFVAAEIARAAIETMREPTEEMKLAGQALAYEGWGDGSEIAKLSWQTMIDAALGKNS